MLFFFRSIIIQIFLNAYIIYRIRKSGYFSKFWKRILIAIYIAEVLLYFTGLFFTNLLPVETAGIIHKSCGIWTVSQIYLAGVIWLFDLLPFIIKRRFSRFCKIVCFISMCVLIGIGLLLGYHNFTHPVVKNHSFVFGSDGVTNATEQTEYKILVASDFHLGYIIDAKMLKKYVNLINAQHPDIVVITGDLVDWDLRPLIESNMQEELKNIRAGKGVFFVPGNHEYKLDAEATLNWIVQSGMTILKDSIVNIDDKLWLIGRDDEENDERQSPADLMKDFDTSKPCIMFVHRPSGIKDVAEYNIPLIISGHTHSGQIFPVNLFIGLFYTNPYGWMKKNDCHSYTTSGLGLSGFPLRIGSHCEAVVFDIRIY